MCSVNSLLVDNLRKLKRLRASGRLVDSTNPSPAQLDLSKLLMSLEQALKRQLALIRTLVVLNQCFDIRT